MTIQRTVLLSLAGLLVISAPTASAQCSRSIRYSVPAWSYHGPQIPHIAHRPIINPIVPNLAQPLTDPRLWAYQPLPRVTFGGCTHIDDLAHRLEIVMNELCLDLYYNYSHNPGFQVTYAEAYELFQLARGIHAAQHHPDRATLQSQLAGTDHLFHHVRDDVRGWTRNPRRQVGSRGIMAKIEMADAILHRLMEDVGVRIDPVLESPPAPGVLPGNALPGTGPLGSAPAGGAPFGTAPLGTAPFGTPRGTPSPGNAPLPPVLPTIP